MIRKLTVYVSKTTDPHENLAQEKFLTFCTEPEECILFLWQNDHTVVIGRNQNCWKECRTAELEAAGGHLVRRLSGGGAVYHDLGNLNFTFCLRKKEADVPRQLSVICRALSKFGLEAELTGRNDLTVGGRKFSGNAFFDSRGFYYHHGTLLVETNVSEMTRFLQPSESKLRSKSVDSVRSRVVNLSELCPEITVESLSRAMREAFSEVYGMPAEDFPESRREDREIRLHRETFASREWTYGERIAFTNSFARRFSWGEAELALRVCGGTVEEAVLSSDAMAYSWFAEAGQAFRGCRYEPEALCTALREELGQRGAPEKVQAELCGMIREDF